MSPYLPNILFAFLVLLLIFYFIYLLTLLALSKKLVQLQKMWANKFHFCADHPIDVSFCCFRVAVTVNSV